MRGSGLLKTGVSGFSHMVLQGARLYGFVTDLNVQAKILNNSTMIYSIQDAMREESGEIRHEQQELEVGRDRVEGQRRKMSWEFSVLFCWCPASGTPLILLAAHFCNFSSFGGPFGSPVHDRVAHGGLVSLTNVSHEKYISSLPTMQVRGILDYGKNYQLHIYVDRRYTR